MVHQDLLPRTPRPLAIEPKTTEESTGFVFGEVEPTRLNNYTGSLMVSPATALAKGTSGSGGFPHDYTGYGTRAVLSRHVFFSGARAFLPTVH